MKMSLRLILRITSFVLLAFGTFIHARAQNKTFGIGTTTLNPNAALQVDAPNGNQGVLIPRLTTTQRLAMKTNLAAADAGLLVYDTTEKAVFVWIGSDWESSAAISWPLEDTVTNVPNKSNLINLTYSGTDTVGMALFRSTNTNNTFATLFLESAGGRIVFGSTRSAVSPGADFRINNTANNQNAIVGSTNGSGRAIQGINTGTGAAGNFTINNAASAANAVFVQTNGTGPGVNINLTNAASSAAGLLATTTGSGPAVNGRNQGAGNGFAGLFSNTDASNTFPAIQAETVGSGSAIRAFQTTGNGTGIDVFMQNTTSNAPGIVANQTGLGQGVEINMQNTTSESSALRINHSGIGTAISANRPIQATGFIGDGSQLTNLAVGDLTYPFKDSVTTALTGNDVFALKYNNAANKRVLRVESLSPTNGSSALSVQQNGTGLGIFSRIDNAAAGSSAIYGTTNSNLGGVIAPVGVYGESTGTGSLAASFRINNTGNTFPAVFVETNGSGPGINVRNIGTTNGIAGLFTNTVATNTFPAIQASTAGTGPGVRVIQNSTSVGRGMDVFMQNPASTETGISIEHQGLGSAARFTITNAGSTTPGIASATSGTGAAIEATTSTGFAAVYAKREGSSNGNAGLFEITNADNGFPVVQVNSVGKGPALNVSGSGSLGNAGAFSLTNSSSTAAALYASTNGSGSAFLAETSSGFTAVHASRSGAGNGNAGFFEITDEGNTFPVIQSNTVGTGAAGNFKVSNGSNTGPALMGETNGGNLSSGVYGNNTGDGFGVLGRANGTSFGSAAVYGEQLGTGDAAGAFRISNPANTMSGLYGETNGGGPALFANNLGTGRGAQIQINNAANSQAALRAFTNGTGNVGFFTISNSTSTANTLFLETNGTGNNLFVNHTGGSGALMVLQSSGTNVARIDKTGKGFFNGGTQTGGADVAEMFDVEGARESYEPGDVLVISERTDRTVEKSASPVSTKVVGVYATKPGVVLTERGLDESLSDMVPMGVIGVIPTKVCNENGPIKRGDLLVTSSKPGHAMKAVSEKGDGVFPSGAVIGKALENFEAGETGLIKVLVNVK